MSSLSSQNIQTVVIGALLFSDGSSKKETTWQLTVEQKKYIVAVAEALKRDEQHPPPPPSPQISADEAALIQTCCVVLTPSIQSGFPVQLDCLVMILDAIDAKIQEEHVDTAVALGWCLKRVANLIPQQPTEEMLRSMYSLPRAARRAAAFVLRTGLPDDEAVWVVPETEPVNVRDLTDGAQMGAFAEFEEDNSCSAQQGETWLEMLAAQQHVGETNNKNITLCQRLVDVTANLFLNERQSRSFTQEVSSLMCSRPLCVGNNKNNKSCVAALHFALDVLWAHRASPVSVIVEALSNSCASISTMMEVLLALYFSAVCERRAAFLRGIIVAAIRATNSSAVDEHVCALVVLDTTTKLFEKSASLSIHTLRRLRRLVLSVVSTYMLAWPWHSWITMSSAAAGDARVATSRKLFLFELFSELCGSVSYPERVRRAVANSCKDAGVIVENLENETHGDNNDDSNNANLSASELMTKRLLPYVHMWATEESEQAPEMDVFGDDDDDDNDDDDDGGYVAPPPLLQLLDDVLKQSIVSMARQRELLTAVYETKIRPRPDIFGEDLSNIATLTRVLSHASTKFWRSQRFAFAERSLTLRNVIVCWKIPAEAVVAWLCENSDAWEQSWAWECLLEDVFPSLDNSTARRHLAQLILVRVTEIATKRYDAEREEVAAYLTAASLKAQPNKMWTTKNFVWLKAAVGRVVQLLTIWRNEDEDSVKNRTDIRVLAQTAFRAGKVDDMWTRLFSAFWSDEMDCGDDSIQNNNQFIKRAAALREAVPEAAVKGTHERYRAAME
eukprot:PhM_4_TR16350/c0_g1_i2/m.15659